MVTDVLLQEEMQVKVFDNNGEGTVRDVIKGIGLFPGL
jgi:hypothetical protein